MAAAAADAQVASDADLARAGECGLPSALFEGAAVAWDGGQAPLQIRAKAHKDTHTAACHPSSLMYGQ